jgi:poly(3-hydroxybutyrate) depolymerase
MSETIHRVTARVVALAGLLAVAQATGATSAGQSAPPPAAAMIELTVPPGGNFDKADFRLWYPPAAQVLRAVVVLVPGSNGDGRSMAADPFWQEFATRHSVALVGCRFTDKPHDQAFIEHYVNASQGTGQALLEALTAMAGPARHPELAGAPLLLWGMSAGGEFNYEFAAWKPDRVIAFVVNKGGIYYTALAPRATREIPAILFVGEKDLAFRTNTIAGLFAVNRRAGALWAYAQEPGAAHVVGRSRELGALLFEEVLPLRLPETTPPGAPVTLRALGDKTGFIGDLQAMTFQPAAGTPAPAVPTSWLPTARFAEGWQAVVTGKR